MLTRDDSEDDLRARFTDFDETHREVLEQVTCASIHPSSHVCVCVQIASLCNTVVAKCVHAALVKKRCALTRQDNRHINSAIATVRPRNKSCLSVCLSVPWGALTALRVQAVGALPVPLNPPMDARAVSMAGRHHTCVTSHTHHQSLLVLSCVHPPLAALWPPIPLTGS